MEATELHNPLHDLHAAAGAEFQAYDRLEIVSTFGDPQAEYAAIRTSAGLIDLPQRGVLELTGRDRLSFLNNLLTNQTWDKTRKADMPPGSGVYAFFLNLKGRVAADLNVLNLDDRTLLETDARLVEPIKLAFDKYLFAEQVKMAGQGGLLHEFALHGPSAAAVLADAGAAGLDHVVELGCERVRLYAFDVTIWRDDSCGVPGYHVLAEPVAARLIWSNLLASFGPGAAPDCRRLRPVGWAAFNAGRIEAGRPLLGIDYEAVPIATAYPAKRQREQEEGEGNFPGILPAETGLLARAVSFTKGCYLGQEIVARMYARGQVAKQIVGLRLDDDSLPMAGSQVYDDASNGVGVITSSTISPSLDGRAICLALVKKTFVAPGSVVTVPAEGKMQRATVVPLPFLPPRPAAARPG